MFSLEHTTSDDDGAPYDEISLKFNYNGMLVTTFEPEFPKMITKIDIEADNGYLGSEPSNGMFELLWSPTAITLSCGKYGDGRGGSLIIVLSVTPELLQSLRTALRRWKEIVCLA